MHLAEPPAHFAGQFDGGHALIFHAAITPLLARLRAAAEIWAFSASSPSLSFSAHGKQMRWITSGSPTPKTSVLSGCSLVLQPSQF